MAPRTEALLGSSLTLSIFLNPRDLTTRLVRSGLLAKLFLNVTKSVRTTSDVAIVVDGCGLGSTTSFALSLLLDEPCTSTSLLPLYHPTIPPSFRRSPQRFPSGPHHRCPTSLHRCTSRSFSPLSDTTVLEQDQFCSSYTLLYSPNTDEFLTPVDERKPPVQSAKPADTSERHATHGRETCGRDDRPIVHHSADGEGPVAIRRV